MLSAINHRDSDIESLKARMEENSKALQRAGALDDARGKEDAARHVREEQEHEGKQRQLDEEKTEVNQESERRQHAGVERARLARQYQDDREEVESKAAQAALFIKEANTEMHAAELSISELRTTFDLRTAESDQLKEEVRQNEDAVASTLREGEQARAAAKLHAQEEAEAWAKDTKDAKEREEVERQEIEAESKRLDMSAKVVDETRAELSKLRNELSELTTEVASGSGGVELLKATVESARNAAVKSEQDAKATQASQAQEEAETLAQEEAEAQLAAETARKRLEAAERRGNESARMLELIVSSIAGLGADIHAVKDTVARKSFEIDALQTRALTMEEQEDARFAAEQEFLQDGKASLGASTQTTRDNSLQQVSELEAFQSTVQAHNKEIETLRAELRNSEDDLRVAKVEDDEVEEEDNALWSYDNQDDWGKHFPGCAKDAQSPIELNSHEPAVQEATPGAPLDWRYKSLNGLKLVNNGHAMQVEGPFGTLTFPGGATSEAGTYHARQLHFHFPSEHVVDGKPYAGEMHIIHQREGAAGTDGLAIVGLLLDVVDLASTEVGQTSRFFEDLGWQQLPKDQAKPLATNVNLQTFEEELDGPYWSYDGSLTTPPCSQSVHWVILQKPGFMTHAMLDAFRAVFPSPMSRRPQKANDRRVYLTSWDQGQWTSRAMALTATSPASVLPMSHEVQEALQDHRPTQPLNNRTIVSLKVDDEEMELEMEAKWFDEAEAQVAETEY